MFKVDKDNLIVDANDGRPVATFVNSFVAALGVGSQDDTVILRLFDTNWPRSGPLLPRAQVHQFALPAQRAAELGRQLLAHAAQVEKEQRRSPEH
jgi:hypothetical protein